MKLEGSCHCRRVRSTVESDHEIPYQRCYCSICRKTQGGGGWSVNLAADARTLRVTGRRFTRTYHARMDEGRDTAPEISAAERVFCASCGSALWLFDPDWPELLHPFASAIDTPLPVPPEHTHLMLGEGELGGGGRRTGRQAVRRVPRRGHRGLARARPRLCPLIPSRIRRLGPGVTPRCHRRGSPGRTAGPGDRRGPAGC